MLTGVDPAVRPPTAILCVDLDGTLLRTDLLAESVAALARSRPELLLALPFWLSGGRARLKRELGARVELDVAQLPYRQELLRHLRSEKARGRILVLVTGADKRLARQVAQYLGLFSACLASDGGENLVGQAKADALAGLFGHSGFDYAGDGRQDIPVWRRAAGAIVCGGSLALAERVSASTPVRLNLTEPRFWTRRLAGALRLHHWSKNLLLLLPVLGAHQWGQPGVLARALLAIAAFSLCASAGYVINDVLDLRVDRLHGDKRRRPFASGGLPLAAAPPLAAGLAALGLAVSLALPWSFRLLLAGYLALTLVYSAGVKKVAMLDVFWLALLYLWRVLAGHAATGIALSPWILTFCFFLFLSLALCKRVAELLGLRGAPAAHGRGYRAGDAAPLASLGAASGAAAVLVLALYVDSQKALFLYSRPHLLWPLCPVLLFWIGRAWLLVHRGRMSEDPILFALRDPLSYATAAAALAALALAS